jgi:hypothetical protein
MMLLGCMKVVTVRAAAMIINIQLFHTMCKYDDGQVHMKQNIPMLVPKVRGFPAVAIYTTQSLQTPPHMMHHHKSQLRAAE